MMQFKTDPMRLLHTVEQKEKLVDFHIEAKSNVQSQSHFAVREAPDRERIWRIEKKSQTRKTIPNVNKGRPQ